MTNEGRSNNVQKLIDEANEDHIFAVAFLDDPGLSTKALKHYVRMFFNGRVLASEGPDTTRDVLQHYGAPGNPDKLQLFAASNSNPDDIARQIGLFRESVTPKIGMKCIENFHFRGEQGESDSGKGVTVGHNLLQKMWAADHKFTVRARLVAMIR